MGVWDDGHRWCFGCGAYEGRNGLQKLETLRKKIKNGSVPVTLPYDCSDNFPISVRNWLLKYDLGQPDIVKYKFQYSFDKEMLIMPVYDIYDNLLMWQGRYFGDNKNYPKYITKGDPSKVDHILGDMSNHRLVLVEDYISAIKVGQVTTVMPLFGSHLSDERLARLSRHFTNLVLWLDADKAKESLAFRDKARSLFMYVSVVSTKKDPKALYKADIENTLRGL